MSKIFISHSSANNAVALAISAWLNENGWSEHFLDITPARGISPGERWRQALRQAAHRCEVVIFLISRAWLDSKECHVEFHLAQQLGKKLFGVFIEDLPIDAVPHEMQAWQIWNLVRGEKRRSFRVHQDPIVPPTNIDLSESGLTALAIGVRNAGLDPSSFLWPPENEPDRAPYRGLKTLEAADAAVFFGREAEIVRGLEMLRQLREPGKEKLMVILGASGSGKSSFLRAGLRPRLKRDRRDFLSLPVIRPALGVITGDEGLAKSLETASREQGVKGYTRGRIKELLNQSGGFEQLLTELQSAARDQNDPNAPEPTIVVSIDQAEELYAQQAPHSSDHIQQAELFIELLYRALSAPPRQESDPGAVQQEAPTSKRARLIVLLTMRTDLSESLQTDPKLGQLPLALFNLPPPDRAHYGEIIYGPARRATDAGNKLVVDPRLTEELLKDTSASGADALPMLAFMLERLYVEHGGDGDLLLDEYVAFGRMDGAILRAIEAALADPGRSPAIPAEARVQEDLLRQTFIPWLVEVEGATLRRRRRMALWREFPPETQPLVERLVGARLLVKDQRTVGANREVVVEVAHETLLTKWPALDKWLREEADALRWLSEVVDAASEWVETNRSEDWLTHSGERLKNAAKLLARSDFRRRLSADGVAYLDACRTLEDEQLAEARRNALQFSLMLANLAQEPINQGNYDRAMRLSLLAARESILSPAHSHARIQLANTAQLNRTRSIIREAVAFSPDGATVVTMNRTVVGDYTMQLWDAKSGTPIGNPMRQQNEWGWVTGVALSPDSATILTWGSRDRTARLRNAKTGAPIGEPLHHGGPVNAVAFSPDGATAVTGSKDRSARLWNTKTGAPIGEPLRHEDSVILTADALVLEMLGEPLRYEGSVSAAAFSPDGATVLTGSHDHTARLWNAKTGAPIGEPLRHDGPVNAVAFSPDGATVVTGSNDKTARLWKAKTGAPIAEPLRHESPVSTVTFSPDGATVLTRSDDYNTARLWDAKPGPPLGEPLRHEGEVLAVAFSPDGTTILTGSHDRTARLWNAKTGAPVGEPLRHEGSVRGVGFSPNGAAILTGSEDTTARLWDANTGAPIGGPLRHEGPVNAVAFSPDGATVVTGSGGNTALLWDVHWLTAHADDDLVAKVCKHWPASVTTLTEADTQIALVLRGRAGEDACAGYR